jgi:histidine ammonia-lyase
MTACQAIEFRRPLKSSEILEFAHDHLRSFVSFAQEDRVFADDINKIKNIITDFTFVNRINEFAESKKIKLNSGYEIFTL